MQIQSDWTLQLKTWFLEIVADFIYYFFLCVIIRGGGGAAVVSFFNLTLYMLHAPLIVT